MTVRLFRPIPVDPHDGAVQGEVPKEAAGPSTWRCEAYPPLYEPSTDFDLPRRMSGTQEPEDAKESPH